MLVFSIFLVSFVSAGDVAYLYNKPFAVDQNIVDVFNEMGLTVDLIQDAKISTTNFNNYKMIFVNDERFRYGLNYIPIATKPTVVANYFYGLEFGLTDYDGVSQLAGNSPQSVNVNEQIVQVYTQAEYGMNGIAIPYYFLDDENKMPGFFTAARTYTGANVQNGDYNFGDVISYANAGTQLYNGKKTQGKVCFFGIIESDYWTPAARQMFKDCVGFVAVECYSNSDCPSQTNSTNFCSSGDSYKNATAYSCQSPGTALSKCVANTQMNLLADCGEDSCDNYGQNYCKSGNVYHNRTCYDRGCSLGSCFANTLSPQEQLVDTCTSDEICSQGACIEKPILCSHNSDCGANGWLGQESCQGKDVYDSYRNFSCSNPGTTESFCSNSTQLLKKENCFVGCADGSCVDCLLDSDCESDSIEGLFCKSNNVWQDFTDNSCVNHQCMSNVTEQLNETCMSDEICSGGQCLEIACSQHTDCGINGFTGVNYCSFGNSYENFISFTCSNPGTLLSSCSNITLPILQNYCEGECVSGECVNCFNDLSCGNSSFIGEKYCVGLVGGDVFQNYKELSCSNPGTGESNCLSSVDPTLVEDCTMEQACLSGHCVDIPCFVDSDCADSNPLTIDRCINPGNVTSYCSNVPINCASNNDCGFTGFSGTEFCFLNDVFKNYQSATCFNPGTTDSYCFVNITQNFISDCGEDSCDEFGANYCQADNIYHNKTCYDRGCSQGACNSSAAIESVFVQDCSYGCSQGTCLPECDENLDCGNESYSGYVCVGDNRTRYHAIPICLNNSCGMQNITEMEFCEFGCSNGICLPPTKLCGDFSLTVSNLRNSTGIKPSCPETYWYYYDLNATETTGDAPVTLLSRQRTWLNGEVEPLREDMVAKFGTDTIPAGETISAIDRWFCTDFSPDRITEILIGATNNCTNITKQYSIYVTP